MRGTSEEYEDAALDSLHQLKNTKGDLFAQLKLVGTAQVYAELASVAAMKECNGTRTNS